MKPPLREKLIGLASVSVATKKKKKESQSLWLKTLSSTPGTWHFVCLRTLILSGDFFFPPSSKNLPQQSGAGEKIDDKESRESFSFYTFQPHTTRTTKYWLHETSLFLLSGSSPSRYKIFMMSAKRLTKYGVEKRHTSEMAEREENR